MRLLSTLRVALIAVIISVAAFLPDLAAAQASQSKPALWMLRGADSTVYLFGTIHFLQPDTDWRTTPVAAALASARSIVLEVADPDDRAAVVPLIQQYGMSPERPLSSLLTPDEFQRLGRAAETLGASAEQMNPMRPWLAGVMLSGAIPARGGFDAASGVDVSLRAQAARASLAIRGLETPADQIRMLSGFPEDGQLAFLRNTLDSFDQAPTELGQLADAWTRGDIDRISDITLVPMKTRSPTLYQTIIVDRNRRWAGQIVEMLEGSGTTFVAVGALHLAGADSVQHLLGERGIEVVRVQ
jgi:uncharacterized protein